MGAKVYNEPVSPSAAITKIAAQYDIALDALACRALAEPYNMHRVDADIVEPMFGSGLSGKILRECQRQYRNLRHYTPDTVAAAVEFSPSTAYEMARRDTEMDLTFAFECFRDIYGRFVEVQIADFTCGWASQGMTAEEIRVSAEKMRRDKGATARVLGSDGKAEFEMELMASLDGKNIDYPVKPPLMSLRKLMPHHEPGEYIIIAGRTGMGKSYAALNYIYSASVNKIPTCYINLENTPKNVQKRIWQMHSGMKWQHDMGAMTDAETRRAVMAWEEVKGMPFRSHNTGRSLHTIMNTIRQDYYERGIQLAVIDYIQLMRESSYKGQRVSELGEISAEVRALCLELQIPLIALAQINREGERSGDKRPSLTDLRGSGDLEQDATVVVMLYRPDYYQITEDESGTPYPQNYADWHIAKGRETGTALAECRFDPVKGFYDVPTFEPSTHESDFSGPQPFPVVSRNEADIPF